MTRPRLLDLFCGAGGAAVGYHRAGFEVVGVDIVDQPNYPFEFIQASALSLFTYRVKERFDAVHASPPCQRFSDLAKRNGNGHEWPDLIAPTRELLRASGLPYVIENVEGAPLVDPVLLCGTQFPGLRVIRHRLFETSFPVPPLPHGRHPLVFTHDKRKNHYGRLDQNVSFVQVTGGGNATVANKAAAMGIAWMSGKELNEAVPPAFTEYVGRQLLAHLIPETAAGPRADVCEALRWKGPDEHLHQIVDQGTGSR
jgi:DNA (cytosine-5)-methyltransferase 1